MGSGGCCPIGTNAEVNNTDFISNQCEVEREKEKRGGQRQRELSGFELVVSCW